jgi:DNA-binding transcriptional ArsR family regulator
VAEITVPPLPSEDDGAQARIQGRIDLLRTNTNIRHDYVDMMRSLWRQLEPIWRATARDEAEALALELRRRIETATNIGEILPGSHIAMLDRHRSYVAWSVERAEAVIVPLTLNPSGTYLFSFPGQLVISYGPEAARRATVRREQSARAATRFKVLGDPTRVAFVNRLIHGPMSVTDLALYFELAQPTVSAHIKILREAGLLESERSGTYTLYRVSEERLRAFVEEGFADAVRQN